MPGVKSLHQDSESNSKAEWIRGHSIQAIAILVNPKFGFYETLQEDIPTLKKAQENNDIGEAREILHKIRGGLCYSGTPRLEEAFKLLYA